MTDEQTPATPPAPDPGNAPPEQWTGDEYLDDDLDAQVQAATDAPSPLADPNSNPPAADDVPPGSDPDGRRDGDDALAPDTPVPADAVYVDDDQAQPVDAPADQPPPSSSTPARGPGGKFVGKQQPEQTVEGA